MEVVRRFVTAGKPVIGVRTASHGFAPRGDSQAREGMAYWPTFDQDVLGCHYANHHSADLRTTIHVEPAAARNPIVAGLPSGEVPVASSLYKVNPLAAGAVVLVTGRAGDRAPPEPVAWVRTRPDGGRVFSTTLGHPDDFKSAAVVQLLRNGIYWATGLAVPADAPPAAPRK
jgi:type 1 glutamine amidotransferase